MNFSAHPRRSTFRLLASLTAALSLTLLASCQSAGGADAPAAARDLPAPAEVAAAPADATTTASGLAYKVLREGTGARPTAADTVEVHYTGWTTDGQMFDSSVARGKTAKFPLSGVIKGWTEGVQLMKVGEKTLFWIPGNLAYGEHPADSSAPAGLLVFEIELLGIKGG